MRPNKKNRSIVRARQRRIIDRLTYDPLIHKQGHRRKLRQMLQDKRAASENSDSLVQDEVMRFGALNVNGLDLEAHWAVTELTKKYNLDVGLR